MVPSVNLYEPLMNLSIRIRDFHEPFADPQKEVFED
jgi:hypothetical protein